MTNTESARAALASAQKLLEQVTSDIAHIDEFLDWLPAAIARERELEVYYGGDGQLHIEAILAEDPGAVTPPVANEDTAWDAMAEFHDRMLMLLRVVTTQITAELDQPRHCCG